MLASDDIARRQIEIAARRASYSVLRAAVEHGGTLSRSEAAGANSTKATSVDQVLRRLCRADLMIKNRADGDVSYAITEDGRLALDALRGYGAALPTPARGWWVAVKRRPSVSPSQIRDALSQSNPTRVYRCVGDFDYVAVLSSETSPTLVDDLHGRLREIGLRHVEIARIDDL